MNVLSLLQELLMKIDTVIRLTQDCPLTKTDDVGWLSSIYQGLCPACSAPSLMGSPSLLSIRLELLTEIGAVFKMAQMAQNT